jgi:hypothetical protein
VAARRGRGNRDANARARQETVAAERIRARPQRAKK